MAEIMLFGGHGRVALLTSPLLSGRGDHVTAVIRNPDHAEEVRAAGATPLIADIERLSTEQFVDLISGHDAVVWSAGAGGGEPLRTIAVDRDAAISSMDAAEVAGVKRYVMVSYFGASRDHGVPRESDFFTYAEAKVAADQHLRHSSLDWTILAPSALTFDNPSGKIDAGANADGPSHVSRGNVARAVAAALADDSTIHRTIAFNDGATEIAEALRSDVS